MDWWDVNFPAMVRYYKGFERYSLLKTPPPLRSDLNVMVLFGPTGVGKSRWAIERYPEAYWAHDGKWFDGYRGQKEIIFDDYRGHWMMYDKLLRITDCYPYRLQTKGGTVPLCATTIIFTSNFHPQTWYSEEVAGPWMTSPFRRRVHRLIYCHSLELWENVINE